MALTLIKISDLVTSSLLSENRAKSGKNFITNIDDKKQR